MADVQGRREARRRKILENAENRMKRINNLQDRPGKSPPQSRIRITLIMYFRTDFTT